MFPFDDVIVTEGAGMLLSVGTAKSTQLMVTATLVSAKRAVEALNARLKLAAEPSVNVDMRRAYFVYGNVYLFDPSNLRK